MKKIFLTSLIPAFLLVFSMSNAQQIPASIPEIYITNGSGEKIGNHPDNKPLQVELRFRESNPAIGDIRTALVMVTSETEPMGETVELSETAINSGIFRGALNVQQSAMPFPTNKKLEVKQGDRIAAVYTLSTKKGSVNDNVMDECWYKGPDWKFTNTGMSHIVLIPNFAQITIDGEKIQPGDFISVFYEKKNGDKVTLENAGGMGMNVAPGGIKYTGDMNAIAIWGTQEGKNNGLAAGESMKWKIWRAKDGKTFDAVATYMSGEVDPTITDKDKYAIDGISGILTLTAKSGN